MNSTWEDVGSLWGKPGIYNYLKLVTGTQELYMNCGTLLGINKNDKGDFAIYGKIKFNSVRWDKRVATSTTKLTVFLKRRTFTFPMKLLNLISKH